MWLKALTIFFHCKAWEHTVLKKNAHLSKIHGATLVEKSSPLSLRLVISILDFSPDRI